MPVTGLACTIRAAGQVIYRRWVVDQCPARVHSRQNLRGMHRVFSGRRTGGVGLTIQRAPF